MSLSRHCFAGAPRMRSPFSSLALSFNSYRPPPGGTVQKAFPRIPVNSVGGVHLSEPLLAPYLFGPFLLSQAVSQVGDKLPFSSLPLKSSPLAPDWTLGSLCRRFNEDFPLRHLLCPVTHSLGKKLLFANDLGGSYTGWKTNRCTKYSASLWDFIFLDLSLECTFLCISPFKCEHLKQWIGSHPKWRCVVVRPRRRKVASSSLDPTEVMPRMYGLAHVKSAVESRMSRNWSVVDIVCRFKRTRAISKQSLCSVKMESQSNTVKLPLLSALIDM
ncbi:hypothetical protein AVEN_56361-1 [Araneus ventricosus]|uniref:Uncharacterized protein n=1 Tax=Araneus ventricosus TaxID=182803 RepID=A0A4Y2LN36_ARAVE|nr:hypothetical protein AVEN_56361-1 [Araneus ventricosus]